MDSEGLIATLVSSSCNTQNGPAPSPVLCSNSTAHNFSFEVATRRSGALSQPDISLPAMITRHRPTEATTPNGADSISASLCSLRGRGRKEEALRDHSPNSSRFLPLTPSWLSSGSTCLFVARYEAGGDVRGEAGWLSHMSRPEQLSLCETQQRGGRQQWLAASRFYASPPSARVATKMQPQLQTQAPLQMAAILCFCSRPEDYWARRQRSSPPPRPRPKSPFTV